MGKSLKGKELGKGISQRKDGLYQARYTDRFGNRPTLYSKSLSDLRKKLREKQYENDKQINIANHGMTLNEWYDRWLETYKKNCRDTTKRTYAIQYNRLRKELGWRKLSSLNLVILQEAFNNLKTDASRGDCKALLVDMLNCALRSDLVCKNVAINVKAKIENKETVDKRVLTDKEIELIYNVSRGGRIYPFFVIALNTGMRIGEILGLTWDCIDFEKNVICVRKTLCYLPNDGEKAIYVFHMPKTKAGKRDIPMTKEVKAVLLEQRQWHDEISKKFIPQEGFEDLVFTSKTNHPINAANMKSSINYVIKKIRKENPGLQFEHFTPHCLRHTFATNCIAKGMKPKTLQKVLGHNSLQMTMDLYCHVLEETVKEEMALLGDMA